MHVVGQKAAETLGLFDVQRDGEKLDGGRGRRGESLGNRGMNRGIRRGSGSDNGVHGMIIGIEGLVGLENRLRKSETRNPKSESNPKPE